MSAVGLDSWCDAAPCEEDFLLTLQELKWELFIRVSQRSDQLPGPLAHLSWGGCGGGGEDADVS